MPRVDSVVSGTPRLSPPVSASPRAGSASASISPPAAQNHSTGRRMIEVARPCQKPVTSFAARRSSTRRGMIRRRLTPRPITDSSAGSSVADAAIDTSGTSRPPTPIERMNGSGINTSSASPTATTPPENSVARPAVAIVVRSASCGSSVWASSSR